jgi:hypothetical protein
MEMTDNLARLILLIGFVVFAPVGIYHRYGLEPTSVLIGFKRGG